MTPSQVVTTGAGSAITIRVMVMNRPGMPAGVTSAIREEVGNNGAIDTRRVEQDQMVRDITIDTIGNAHTA